MPTAVFRVLKTIADIGARPGDAIIAEPNHPSLPYTLIRKIPHAALVAVLCDSSAVRWERCEASPAYDPPRERNQQRGHDGTRDLQLLG